MCVMKKKKKSIRQRPFVQRIKFHYTFAFPIWFQYLKEKNKSFTDFHGKFKANAAVLVQSTGQLKLVKRSIFHDVSRNREFAEFARRLRKECERYAHRPCYAYER